MARRRVIARAERHGSIECVLRLTLALMCVGQAWWLAVVQETPLVGWLHGPADVGGWEFSEQFALRVQTALACFALVAGGVSLFRPLALLLLPLALLQATIAVAMWQTRSGFQIAEPWLPPAIASLLPFLTQAGRIAAPLTLWLHQRSGAWEAVARCGAALAFAGHGLEAFQRSPEFTDLILLAGQRFGADLSETAVGLLLSGIGIADFMVAALLMARRWRFVAAYAAVWGLATAGSRMAAYGAALGWHETLMRSAHFGLPLALAIYWWRRPVSALAAENKELGPMRVP